MKALAERSISRYVGVDAQRVAVVGGDDLELVASGHIEHVHQGLVDDFTNRGAPRGRDRFGQVDTDEGQWRYFLSSDETSCGARAPITGRRD